MHNASNAEATNAVAERWVLGGKKCLLQLHKCLRPFRAINGDQHVPSKLIRHCRLRLQALVFRLLLLSTVSVESSGAVVVIQMLHGPCFACFWIAAVDYANTSAPQGMEGTAQSLVSTCMYIVGPGIGSVVWSYIYQSYGAPVAYICGASVAAANAVALGKLQLAQPATQPLRAMRP